MAGQIAWKTAFCFINAVFFLIGLVTIIAGVLFYGKFSQFGESGTRHVYLLNQPLQWPAHAPFLAIPTGVVLVIIAVFGCCGAARKNRCVLSFYSIAMLAIVAMQVACAVLVFTSVADMASDAMFRDALKFEFHQGEIQPSRFYEHIEEYFQCCGVDGPMDYRVISLPRTCCAGELNAGAMCNYVNANPGCTIAVSHYLKTALSYVGGASVIGAVMGILGVSIAFKLMCAKDE